MQNHFSLQKILHILNERGYGHSNQKGLVQSCKDGKVLLNICADLLKQCEPSFIRSILATSAYKIGEHMDHHKNSLPIISDIIVIREIFKITRMDFRIMDFIKPSNDRIMYVLSHIYSILWWEKKLKTENETPLAKQKILKNSFAKVKDQLTHVQRELLEVQTLKARQKPKFIELSSHLAALKSQIHQLKSLKNERISSKYLKQKTKSELKRQSEQLSYKKQAICLQINQAKMKLSQNAPQIKKQKLRQEATLFQITKQQQNINNFYNDLLNTIKNEFDFLDKEIMLQLTKSKQFKQFENAHYQLNSEIDDLVKSYLVQKEKFDIIKDNLVKDQQLFYFEEQRENNLNGSIAQKLRIQEDYRRKQVKLKNLMIVQQKNIDFFQNGLRIANGDLDTTTKKTQQLIHKTEIKLSQLQFQANQWTEQLFMAIKRVNQYYNPEDN